MWDTMMRERSQHLDKSTGDAVCKLKYLSPLFFLHFENANQFLQALCEEP